MNDGLSEAIATADEHRGGDASNVGVFVKDLISERETQLSFYILSCKTDTLYILPGGHSNAKCTTA